MKKIKIMKIVLIVILSLVIIGLVAYNYIGIMILKTSVEIENSVERQGTILKRDPYGDVESDLIASGIDEARAQQISDNVKSKKYIKEALGDKYEETMQDISDNEQRCENLLKAVKQLKWYNISNLVNNFQGYFEAIQ